MVEPGDEIAAGASCHGRLRASHADREQVIGVLTVSVRRPQAAMAARACRDLVSWLYHPRYHPHSTMNEA